ncbi:hypothetical protein P4S68_16115 [Pseudoalteromonas sp. Hal099]
MRSKNAVVLETLQQKLELNKYANGSHWRWCKRFANDGKSRIRRLPYMANQKLVEQAQAAICQGSLLQLLYMLAIPLNK